MRLDAAGCSFPAIASSDSSFLLEQNYHSGWWTEHWEIILRFCNSDQATREADQGKALSIANFWTLGLLVFRGGSSKYCHIMDVISTGI